jgi:purine-binding chemotaxis protein CheW
LSPTPLQRALGQAPERESAQADKPEKEVFLFKIGTLYLAVDSANAREVTRLGVITPLPRAASFVLGVGGHRGEVLPVIDLLRFFGQGEMKVGAHARCFIGVSGTFAAAFVADEVIGLRRVLLEEILPAPVGGEVPSEHVQGVLPDKALKATLTMLDFPRVLQAARTRAVTR